MLKLLDLRLEDLEEEFPTGDEFSLPVVKVSLLLVLMVGVLLVFLVVFAVYAGRSK